MNPANTAGRQGEPIQTAEKQQSGLWRHLRTFPSSWPPSMCARAFSASSRSLYSTYANPLGRFTTCRAIPPMLDSRFLLTKDYLDRGRKLNMPVSGSSSDNKRKSKDHSSCEVSSHSHASLEAPTSQKTGNMCANLDVRSCNVTTAAESSLH